MSPHPGSSPPVDVQKYIGSCLITQQPRSKRRPIPRSGPRWPPPPPPPYAMSPHYPWAGVPLFSVHHPHKQHPRRFRNEYEDVEEMLPMARLAIHAEGAPLILSPPESSGGYFAGERASSSPHSDTVSTTSEESACCLYEASGGRHLPRIIKPRKRRKKDIRRCEEDCGPLVTLKPYQPLCFEGGRQYPGSTSSSTRSRQYPYRPSSRCKCAYCMPPPSTLLTPPDSPVSSDGKSGSRWSASSDEEVIVLTSSHPPQRPWITMTDEPRPHSQCAFTVMCYNILCDKYATRQMFGYCPNWALDWTYRKTHILQELLHYKADIISLQEVETEQFYSYFQKELEIEGYEGIFSPKSRAKTMSEGERKHVDGCAIFYKRDKFSIVRQHLMEFNQLAMANAEGCDDMLNRVMTKDNIGLAALLQTKIGAYPEGTDASCANQYLLVCNAHIHWDPEYSDVKLVQTMMLMHELKSFADDFLLRPKDPGIVPLLLCGDFNSLPDSGVIEYLSSSRVSSCHCDFRDFVYKDCLNKLGASSKSNEFSHPFQISRAYKDGIMPFTNYSFDFKGVIDYVFYSHLHMSVLGVLGAVDGQWLSENRIQGCPHPHIPSDHFPIVVELLLRPTPPLRINHHHHHHQSATQNGVVVHR